MLPALFLAAIAASAPASGGPVDDDCRKPAVHHVKRPTRAASAVIAASAPSHHFFRKKPAVDDGCGRLPGLPPLVPYPPLEQIPGISFEEISRVDVTLPPFDPLLPPMYVVPTLPEAPPTEEIGPPVAPPPFGGDQGAGGGRGACCAVSVPPPVRPVPEPASWLLFLAAAGGMTLFRTIGRGRMEAS